MTKRTHKLSISVLFWSLILGMAATIPARGQEAAPADAKPVEQAIHVTADKLVIEMASNRAVFSGNAKAVQGQTTVSADQLTVIYSGADSRQSDLNTNSVQKIIALGHVRIEMADRTIIGDKAESINTQHKIVVSGPGTKIIAGKDEVSGKTITYFQDEDRVEISGGVKALIHTTERGLN